MLFEKLKDINLLYVEDDEDSLNATSIILEDYVKHLFCARDGEEALAVLEEQEIDLIITDILMPKLNGIELIRNLRKQSQQIPVIITTAHTETQYLLDAIHLKVDGYLLKPIVIDDLFAVLEKTILPTIQAQTIHDQNLLINAISTFVGGKKIEIIRYLLQNIDNHLTFHGSYEDIMQDLNISKPTVVKTFRQLMDIGLVTKIKNKVYQIHPKISSAEMEKCEKKIHEKKCNSIKKKFY